MSLGLLGAYQSGSDDSDSDSSDQDIPEVKPDVKEPVPAISLDNPFGAGGSRPLLPQPSFMQEQQGKIQGLKFDSSVFSNPFRYNKYIYHGIFKTIHKYVLLYGT